MAEWIGRVIADWPIWLIIPIVILVVIGWFMWQTASSGWIGNKRYEWPEDKKRRLEKAKLKAKKG